MVASVADVRGRLRQQLEVGGLPVGRGEGDAPQHHQAPTGHRPSAVSTQPQHEAGDDEPGTENAECRDETQQSKVLDPEQGLRQRVEPRQQRWLAIDGVEVQMAAPPHGQTHGGQVGLIDVEHPTEGKTGKPRDEHQAAEEQHQARRSWSSARNLDGRLAHAAPPRLVSGRPAEARRP